MLFSNRGFKNCNMKIVKIEITGDTCMTIEHSKFVLYTLKVTVKTFWGKTKELIAYPTSRGPTYWSGEIHHYIYTDSLGNEFSTNMCEQFNNFCRINQGFKYE